jgi:HNH endonuclease
MMPKWKRDLKTYRRNDWVCQYCGYDFKTSCDAFWRGCISVDHLKPRKYGGSDDETNRFTCCHLWKCLEDGKFGISELRLFYVQPIVGR